MTSRLEERDRPGKYRYLFLPPSSNLPPLVKRAQATFFQKINCVYCRDQQKDESATILMFFLGMKLP